MPGDALQVAEELLRWETQSHKLCFACRLSLFGGRIKLNFKLKIFFYQVILVDKFKQEPADEKNGPGFCLYFSNVGEIHGSFDTLGGIFLFIPPHCNLHIFGKDIVWGKRGLFKKINKQEADWLKRKCPSFCFLPMGPVVCSGTLCLCSVLLLSPHNWSGSSLQFLLKDCCLVHSHSPTFGDLNCIHAAALQGLHLPLLPTKI